MHLPPLTRPGRSCRAHLQVYKSHLVETGGGSGPTLDSAHANLANTFVNAFVNAGFGQVQHMRVSLAASWLLH